MRVLYLDRLFLLEVLGDALLLWAAGKLCGARRQPLRLVLAGLTGGSYAVLALFFPPAVSLSGKAVTLLLMLLIAYGREKALWKLGLAYLFLCALYGGIAAAVTIAAGRATARALLFSAGVSLGVCALPFRFAGRHGERCRLTLRGEGGSIELTALRDSGHRIADPFTGKPVIIASEETLAPLFSREVQARLRESRELSPQQRLALLGRGFFLLPLHTVSGNCLTLCGKAEEAVLDGESIGSCRVAFSREEICTGDGCRALISRES